MTLVQKKMVSESLTISMAAIEASKKGESNEPQPSAQSFEKLLLDAVDEVFSSFGDLYAEAVYLHLAEAFNIKKKDIPFKVDEFISAVEKTFEFGAKIIQIQILENLHEKIGQDFKFRPKGKNLMLTNYLSALHQFFDSQVTAKASM
jgi:hypothetical protein